MADQKNRGGQKKGNEQPGQSTRKEGITTAGGGGRSDKDKRSEQMSNPDDEARQPTNEQR